MSDWDWNKKIPMWDWHEIALSGFPDWEKPNGEIPASVFLTIVNGIDKSSHKIASETDDTCKGKFYYRDYTKSGLPFIRESEIYNSRFWFQFQSDAQNFATRYASEVESY